MSGSKALRKKKRSLPKKKDIPDGSFSDPILAVLGPIHDTFKPYGLEYKKAGRAFQSFAAIAGRDSDGDGHPNAEEIADLRNPGDPVRPGRPDRSVSAGRFGDGWDYSERIDHNAGSSVRGACVIRLNPTPEGYEEYDWKNGWSLIGERKIVIFGRSVVAIKKQSPKA